MNIFIIMALFLTVVAIITHTCELHTVCIILCVAVLITAIIGLYGTFYDMRHSVETVGTTYDKEYSVPSGSATSIEIVYEGYKITTNDGAFIVPNTDVKYIVQDGERKMVADPNKPIE